MKRLIITVSVIILSIILSSTVYATETEPKAEKNVVTKTKSITITTIQRPIRGIVKDLKGDVGRVRILRSLRSKIRSLLGVVEDAIPLEQEVEK